jgi:hypothetical protein
MLCTCHSRALSALWWNTGAITYMEFCIALQSERAELGVLLVDCLQVLVGPRSDFQGQYLRGGWDARDGFQASFQLSYGPSRRNASFRSGVF